MASYVINMGVMVHVAVSRPELVSSRNPESWLSSPAIREQPVIENSISDDYVRQARLSG